MPGAEKGLEGSQHWSLKLDKNNSQDLTWSSDFPRNPCTLEKGIYMQTYKLSSPFCLARALSLPSSWAVAGAWPSSYPASNPEAILLPAGSGTLAVTLSEPWLGSGSAAGRGPCLKAWDSPAELGQDNARPSLFSSCAENKCPFHGLFVPRLSDIFGVFVGDLIVSSGPEA